MTKTIEQTFKCKVNYEFDISLEDLKCLFCTMGQGSGYWANNVTVGNIEEEEDEDGNVWYKEDQDYEHEGCCAWLKELTLDSPIKIIDCEDGDYQFKVKDSGNNFTECSIYATIQKV